MKFDHSINIATFTQNHLQKLSYSLDFLYMLNDIIFHPDDEYNLKEEDGWFALYHKSILFKTTTKIADFGNLEKHSQKDIMTYIASRAENVIYVEYMV